MNEYEIETFEMHRRPQTTTHRVRAHSAADALTCFEKSNHLHHGYVSGIRCVDSAPTFPGPFGEHQLFTPRCSVCGVKHAPACGTGL